MATRSNIKWNLGKITIKMTKTLYKLGLIGAPTHQQSQDLKEYVAKAIEPYNFELGREVVWSTNVSDFNTTQNIGSALAFFGSSNIKADDLSHILLKGIPIIPIASNFTKVHDEIPESLCKLNCISFENEGIQRIASALLECAGLLPKQRRVFLSYKRDESRDSALQLFSELSARRFDVFLDTHGVAPAVDFQAMLWHRLCESDVLVMLDTPQYFNSRWTAAEFGRAQAKGISILRVGWPNVIASNRVATTTQIYLNHTDIDTSGQLANQVISNICSRIESLRSQSHAVRQKNLYHHISQGVESIGGTVLGTGQHRAVHIHLPDGKEVFIYPSVGVPTALTLNDAFDLSTNPNVAVVYDDVGLHPDWASHLSWLNSNMSKGRYIKAHEIGWEISDWENR